MNEKSTVAYPYKIDTSLPEHRHLQLGEPEQEAIRIIADTAINAMRNYLRSEGFREVWSPTITLMAGEDTATLFTFHYYEDLAHLSQTAQPYLEALVSVSSFKKVFSLTPTYRRERLQDKRHLAEFYSLEVEKGHSDLEDIMSLNERMFSVGVQRVIEENRKELDILGRDVEKLNFKIPLKRISYDEVVEFSKNRSKEGKKIKIEWGESLAYELVETLCKEYEAPFFVTHLPEKIRPFYTQPDPKRKDITLSYDMFAPYAGEVATGTEKITDMKLLSERIEKHHLPFNFYRWYVDLRNYDIPHAGFGMGIERALQYVTGLEDITKVSLFPRVPFTRPYP
ncbi:MAG: asparagine--tRNA ligase [Candidatus Aenigmarchaeota archaeon]|nr:asparagine--tRNA ligase [Candidatus Aenigmarchaeota archaeon]